MKNLFGITNIQVKAIEVVQNDVHEVNEFLMEHNGNIVDITIVPMFQGLSRYVITYRKEN